MLGRMLSVTKFILGKTIAGRDFKVWPDDTFIVSHPRSGNTWIRFLISNLVQTERPATLMDMERITIDTEARSKRYVKSAPRPRILKSHQYFDSRYMKVVYIVRDARDVALSYYNFQRKYKHIEDSFPFERYVTCFVAGATSDFGSWQENVLSWLGPRYKSPRFHLVRYEDIYQEPERELERVASFMGIHASPKLLAQAVERSSASRMRDLEKAEGDQWQSTKGRRKDIPFVGPARPGRWKSDMPQNSVAKIEQSWGPLMKTLGYEVITRDFKPLKPPFVQPMRWNDNGQ